MILVIKGILRYFLVAPLGIGVSNSNGGKNEADALCSVFIHLMSKTECLNWIITHAHSSLFDVQKLMFEFLR